MLNKFLIVTLVIWTLAGCSEGDPGNASSHEAPWVKTFVVEPGADETFTVSATVLARIETPVAFQVGGRILSRHIDAGQHVEAGQLLFTIDPRDLDEAERVAQAQLTSAIAAQENAYSELERQKQLLSQNFISRQALERVELASREAQGRVQAARAQLEQARNARSYAQLHALHAGIITEVYGESGQVVSPGQTVAVLAQDGAREVEVFLADARHPPLVGRILAPTELRLALREIAGAADPISRTWRARYEVLGTPDEPENLPLGAVVRVELQADTPNNNYFQIPLGALDERGSGPQVWQIVDGRAEPVAVQVISLEPEVAIIQADLSAGTRLIALGTHLLTRGMVVRERAP